MLQILNQYEQDGFKITEYTKDGVTVSHTVKTSIPTEPTPQPYEPTNSEIAQIISDLQADLIIAGVI